MESNTNSKSQNVSQNSQTQKISQNKNEPLNKNDPSNTTMLINGKTIDSVISYADLKNVIPGRKDFLDPNESSKIDRLISSREEIAFLPTYLMETHMQDEKYQKAKYKIILMGIFKDGRRVNVILDNIEPYFEVRIPDGDSESMKNQIADIIERLNRDELTTPVKKSLISAKPFKYYQPNKSKFLRLYYTKTKNRQAAINLIRKEGYQTTSDDLNSYYRVVCRDYLTTFSSWASLAKYEPCQSTLLKGETYRLNIADYKIYSGTITNDMLRDKSMSMCWDVETWSPDGAVPQPEVRSNAIFCLSTTFHWVNEKDPFLKICFCDYPANAKPGYLSVICGTELNIIKAFSEVYAKLRPEFIFGFNDSDYDWPWLVKRAAQTKGTLIKLAGNFDATKPWQEYTDDYVMKFNYKKEHVKVEATNYVDGYSLMMPGYIPIDVRTIFRQLYPTAEYSSLKWFLAKNKLGGKEDMPYEKMFKIYTEYREFMDAHGWNPKEDADVRLGKKVDLDVESLTQEELITYSRLKADLGEINSYCVVDAIRCHDLVKIRSVIMDKREVSHKSYCSLYDAFYRANGMKVRNLTIAIGQTEVFKTRFSNINNSETEDGKYPGGFVLPPKKGLRISKLSIEERIAKAKVFADKGKTSQKDNPCFEWLATTLEEVTDFYATIKDRGCVLDEDQLASLEETRRLEGKPKLPKKFKDFLRESIGRPITGLDFSSLYPSLIRAYNFSPEYCILDKKLAREIEGTGQRLTKVDFDFNGRRRIAYFIWHNNKLDPKEEGFQFGIYPYILDGLFNERAALKKKMKVFDHRKEQIEAMTKEEQNSPAIAEEYIDVCFNKNYLNCKQNALKVFMNTFYGECGNKLSPFFVLEVAGGITTYGKKNIQFAHAFVKEEGCNVYYGDTDSLYLSVPEKVFKEFDLDFYTGKISKLDYWTRMVETSFTAINPIRDGVNKAFLENNGTKFLSMAYEEILYPVAFTAKKKYFGIPHENIANFQPKELFVRGLEVKKRGVSDLLKENFMEIMWTSVNPANLYDLVELVLAKIDMIYAQKWDPKYFIQTGVYRPTKNNVKIKRFVERMAEKKVEIKPNERFDYVIVKKYPYTYDLRGRKKELSIGDKLEMKETVIAEGMEIDLDYYMQGSVNGQLARLITYHEMFEVDPIDNTVEERDVAEVKAYKNACKFIENYCSKYYAKYNTFGKTYQKIYKTASKYFGGAVGETDNMASMLLSANVDYDDFETWFMEFTNKAADKLVVGYGEKYITDELNKVNEIVKNRHSSDEEPITKQELNREIKERRNEMLKMLQKVYYNNRNLSIKNVRENSYKETISILRTRIRDSFEQLMKLYKVYNSGIESVIEILKDKLAIDNQLQAPTQEQTDYKFEDFDVEIDERLDTELSTKAQVHVSKMFADPKILSIINLMKALYGHTVAAHLYIKRTYSIVDYLKQRRNNEVRAVVRPDDSVIREAIQRSLLESKDELMKIDI